jgi:hypothetical protein
MNENWYFNGGDGKRYYFGVIAAEIRSKHPRLVGAHIFEQLDALGLRFVFRNGDTPYPLPRSFTD